ncbi:iron complex transport system substrate-binding protein [Saccharopolyspora erythraea NRRL 2338]|uniref:Ferrichrome ABC transporter substrate-binding protein n=2 Tax=Saccharopolyspora erythraea TaxID=1836 RepID=A4FH22_SACEN|nr:ABC transporter substrate-binding protein [Saccharopolyspora erythraea]EQD82455.1 ferrichrome ABC transporter substrate-binding protein [Saccharopolyspora erythraea D]PFG97050.1 iron complex transport system substrate-binding protein [Saccharopolyspora erythraea NRRL 2338]QRK87256.1 ABC transporter substrate-binding protein [Saccharopolyspora erythraea]CAM03347.1 ferrichrome ABC transporter substrate-binding protein [Saccharopolyspora erythraea NRRL 2338]
MRRKIGAIAGLIAVTGALAGCAPPEPAADSAGGRWSYTDDRGVTVNADQRPQRFIAQVSAAGALKDFGVDVVGTFGPLVKDDGTTENEAGSVNPAEVTDVTGPAYGELNMERVASLHPDLLVSGKYAEFPGLWHLTQDQEETAKSIVQTVGVQQSGVALPESIRKYEELARALGGDVDSPRVRADEEAFNAAAQRLRGLGERLRSQNRSILAVGGTPQEYFVVVPARNPDLGYYVRELGLPITTPAHPDTAGGGYFERLSWENANAYSGDILLWDTRRASMNPEQMKQNPLFAAQPAAAANRFVEWDAVAPMSYASYARIMNKLADQIERTMAGMR